jgi:membrane-bound inhibitor of C-type lysozyme
MDQPLPIRVVVQPNFTESGQTKGTASILDDRGRRKERFEGSIELGKSVDANNGAWHLDLESRMLRIVQPVAGRSARFMIYRCGANGETPKPRRFVFRCEDSQRVVATFRDGNPPTVMVEFGKDERRVLPIGRTGSGARYADKGYIFWNKGNSAIWTTPERETTCVTNQ